MVVKNYLSMYIKMILIVLICIIENSKSKLNFNLRPKVFCWLYKAKTTSKKSQHSLESRNNPCLKADSKVLQKLWTTACSSVISSLMCSSASKSEFNSVRICESVDMMAIWIYYHKKSKTPVLFCIVSSFNSTGIFIIYLFTVGVHLCNYAIYRQGPSIISNVCKIVNTDRQGPGPSIGFWISRRQRFSVNLNEKILGFNSQNILGRLLLSKVGAGPVPEGKVSTMYDRYCNTQIYKDA